MGTGRKDVREAKRNWTQDDMVEETRRRNENDAKDTGFFNLLYEVTGEAFGDANCVGETPTWQFEMGTLTIGEVLDFFAPQVVWHNQTGGPSAYIGTDDYDTAEAFRDRFGIPWLTPDELQDLIEEDTLRAGGWRP